MKRTFISFFFALFSLFAFSKPSLPEVNETIPKKIVSIFNAPYADLAFSGMLNDEHGEAYEYFLSIERIDNQYLAEAILTHRETKKLLLHERSEGTFEKLDSFQWQMGNIFLKYNPINNSWTFGSHSKNKGGFNLRADMLGLTPTNNKTYELRKDLYFELNETGPLNGNLEHPEHPNTLFVTGKWAWFQQIFGENPLHSPVTAVFCNFKEGQAIYSVSLPVADALQGSIAEYRSKEGKMLPISQFIQIGGDTIREIDITSPKIHIAFDNLLNKTPHIAAGFTTGNLPGFCMIRKPKVVDAEIIG